MSRITSYETHTTTLETLLGHYKSFPEGDLEAVVRFLNKQLGLTNTSDLVNLDWDGDIFSLVSLLSDIKTEGKS